MTTVSAAKARRSLGGFLKRAREKRGLTQHEVAQHLAYSTPQFVSNWERGVSAPPRAALPLLAKHLGISPREMITAMTVYERALADAAKLEIVRAFRRSRAG